MKLNIIPKLCLCGMVIVSTICLCVSGSGNKLAVASTWVEEDSGAISTLYALDPLMRTFCFAGGVPGLVLQNNQARNRCSDIDFNTYHANSFSTGVEGGRLGVIIDLGGSETLAHRYRYSETMGGGQAFFSLHLLNGKIVILNDLKTHDTQEITENAALFTKGDSIATAPVKLGHIYLLRITDRFDQKFQRLVKLLVIAHTSEQSVTIRWQLL